MALRNIRFHPFRMQRNGVSELKEMTKPSSNAVTTQTYWSSKGKGKCKVLLRTSHEGTEGEQMYSSTLSSTSALDEVVGQRHAPGRFTPREILGTRCLGVWVGPRDGLDGCRKSRPPPGFDPRTVQPVASRYTDWTVAACTFLIAWIWKQGMTCV